MNIIAIIPARGGSKRIHQKNIAPVCGKPLLAYSIEVALACPSISQVIVSTDVEKIAEVARNWGARVPFLRPKTLATDVCSPGEATVHALKYLQDKENYSPDILVEMYPTSPFRTPGMLEYGIHLVVQGYDSVQTVRPMVNMTRYFSIAEGGRMRAVLSNLPTDRATFRPYGIFSVRCLHPLQIAPHTFIPITDPIPLIDIDYPEDLLLAERIIREDLFDFTQRTWSPEQVQGSSVGAATPARQSH